MSLYAHTLGNSADERAAQQAPRAAQQPVPDRAAAGTPQESEPPHVEDQHRGTRCLDLWAVISIPLLLSGIAVALTASPLAMVTTMLSFARVFIGHGGHCPPTNWAADEAGDIVRTKALTTPADYTDGVVDAVGHARQNWARRSRNLR